MCFGEKFPDGRALEKKLVRVKVRAPLRSFYLQTQRDEPNLAPPPHFLQVVPLICQHFHEMAHLEGASSLHSSNISLQISHNSLYDLINSVFGVPMAEQEMGRWSGP